MQSLAFSGSFIGAISQYISHLDPAVRRCGMRAAELVAERTNKTLDFKQWEGEGKGQEWARAVRKLVTKRDADAEEAPADVLRLELMNVDEPKAAKRTRSQRSPHAVRSSSPRDKKRARADNEGGYL